MAEKYRHTRTERNALLRELRRVIDTKDEREFMNFLRENGIKDEDPRFSKLVRAFRDGKIDDLLGKKT